MAWLFATLDGISKVGTYTGTGVKLNIDCGFTGNARLVIIRRLTGGGGHWMWFDTVQGIVSGNDQHWRSNTTGNPTSSTDYIDPYTGGFSVFLLIVMQMPVAASIFSLPLPNINTKKCSEISV